MNYIRMDKFDMLNGEGCRVLLWVAGCDHHCPGCHNPETWDPKNGIPFTEETKKEIFEALDKDYISGITYTGGDPLFINNLSTITDLAKEIREKYPNKTQWLYTGFLYPEIQHLEIMDYLDVVVDGPFIEYKKDPTLQWRGSSNQKIIRLR